MQFQIKNNHYRLRFKPAFFLLCLFFTCLMFYLGVWQLHRYHFKKNLLDTYQQRLTASPTPLSHIPSAVETLQFLPVSAEGRYLNDMTMLLQNQFHEDKVGFDVLTPFQIPGDTKLLLVDRGWVGQTDDQQLPKILSITGEQKVVGHIKLLNEYVFILGKNIYSPDMSPLVMQKIDIADISRITHQAFYPFVVRLNAEVGPGYVRDWTITTVMPERHMAYAVQWFVMAVVLMIAYFCFCCEKMKEDDHAK